MEMKRKDELEVIIPSMARRLSMMFEHIGNGNTEDFDFLDNTKSEMQKLTQYIDELRLLTMRDNPIVATFSDKRNEL